MAVGVMADLHWGIQTPLSMGRDAEGFALTAQCMSNEVQQPVRIVPLHSDYEILESVKNGTVDFVLAGSSVSACMQAIGGVRPLATLITNNSGIATSLVGGIIFTRASRTDITEVKDVKGKTVAVARYSSVASAQSQWGYLKDMGIDLFTDTEGVAFANSSRQAITDVASGVYDIGFAFAGEPLYLQNIAVLQLGALKVLDAKTPIGYPYAVTTALYPGYQISAVQTLDQELISTLLICLQTPSPAAGAAGGFTGVAPALNVFQTLRLQSALGVQVAPSYACLDVNSRLAAIQCPAGQHLQHSQCKMPCSKAYICSCHPCVEDTNMIGSLSVSMFLVSLLVPLLFLLCVALLIARAYHLHVPLIPVKDCSVSGTEATLNRGSYRGNPAIFCIVPQYKRIGLHTVGIRNASVRAGELVEKRAKLQHEHLAPCMGLCVTVDGPCQVFLGGEHGTLQQVLLNPSIDLDETYILHVITDIVDALLYLHGEGISGVPIRTSDIVVDRWGHIQLLASLTSDVPYDVWQAPEVLNGEKCSYNSDIYSLGMLMYEVLHRQDPYLGQDSVQVLNAVKDVNAVDRIRERPDVQRRYDLDILYDTMYDCWVTQPDQRPSMREIHKTLRVLFQQHMVNSVRRSMGHSTITVDVAKPTHVHNATFLYASGAQLEYLFKEAVHFNVQVVPCNKNNTFLGMALDIDGALQVVQLAYNAIGAGVIMQAAIHCGKVTRCLMPLSIPRFCILGPALAIVRILLDHSRPDSLLMSSVTINCISAQYPMIGNLHKRPGTLLHRGFQPIDCFWFTVPSMHRALSG